MRHIIAIAAAVGFLFAVSAPTFASTDLSAAKKPTAAQCKKNPKMKGCDKMSGLSTDLSAAKKPTAAQCKKNPKMKGCDKMSSLSVDLSAAKKVDCKDPKNAKNKACKNKM